MIKFYAIQASFYESLSKYPKIVDSLLYLPRQQKRLIFVEIEKQAVVESAGSFFQCPVYEEGDMLLLSMGSQHEKCWIKEGILYLFSIESPLLELLKRLYPYHLVEVNE